MVAIDSCFGFDSKNRLKTETRMSSLSCELYSFYFVILHLILVE